MPDTPPDPTAESNPFELVAYLLFKVRQSLEEPGPTGRPPRWIRIIRAREAKGEVIGGGVQTIVGGFANGVSYLAELSLDIEELLLQTDAGKALLEVSLDLLRAATDETFIAGVHTLVGADASGNPAAGVNSILTQIKDKLKYIPEPEDVTRLGHELYRLLCVEQRLFPRKTSAPLEIDEAKILADDTYVDVDRSGKMRLLQWGYDNELKVFGLGPKEDPESKEVPLKRFGARWLWQGDGTKLPKHTAAFWSTGSDKLTLYEFAYDSREQDATLRAKDLVEAHELLKALGYVDNSITDAEKQQFTTKLGRLLRQFQHINSLPKTGELDNATVNRLLNMDFAAKNLRRARPFDQSKLDPAEVPDAPTVRGGYLDLVNPDADHPEDEGIDIITPQPGYEYYVAGATPPVVGKPVLAKGRGWINYAEGKLIPGFVAVRSRRRVQAQNNSQANFEGGIWSEGEAASGKYFFCARGVEPWIPGRQGVPGSNATYQGQAPLFGGTKPNAGEMSGMYQWLPIGHLMQNKPADSDLVLSASVLRRSLYTDRSRTTGLPDRGLLALNVYDATFYKGPDTRFERDKEIASADSPWYPTQEQTTAALTLSQVERGRVWVLQATPELIVPAGAVAALVGLAGQYQSAYDIDAYFDNVIVRWDYRKKAA